MPYDYDVLVSHNSQDKPALRICKKFLPQGHPKIKLIQEKLDAAAKRE